MILFLFENNKLISKDNTSSCRVFNENTSSSIFTSNTTNGSAQIITLKTLDIVNIETVTIAPPQSYWAMPLNAMKARDMSPAMTSAMGVPAIILGMRQVSRRSRTPAMSSNASRKPRL